MAQDSPIGIFDSGLGGLSVWREIRAALPAEDLIYVADQLHCPYGRKSEAFIQNRAQFITDFFLSQQCKLIVLACNTATAAAIHLLRKQYELPFVGMEPALKPAAKESQSGVVGILATHGTLRGGHFLRNLSQVGGQIKVLVQEGEGLVEAVEQGRIHYSETEGLLRQYVQPLLEAGADQIVLGCTHYPFLWEPLEKILAGQARLIDPAPAIARRVHQLLEEIGQLKSGGDPGLPTFYTSGDKQAFQASVAALLKDGAFSPGQFPGWSE